MLSLVISLLFFLMQRAHAGHYYCTNITIEMNCQKLPVDHLVIPREPDILYSSKRLACRWVFTLNFTSDPILLLNGFDVAKVDLSRRLRVRRSTEVLGMSASRIQYRLSDGSFCSSKEVSFGWQPIELETLQVLQLPKRSKMYIEFDQNWHGYLGDTPGLRIRLMERGFCSSDTVNYNSNCYATSLDRGTVKQQLTSMSRYGGQAQLASFNSAKDLQSFVNESQRTLAGSGMQAQSKLPLNLTQPVRIGLFYQRLESSIYYLADSNGELVMKLLPDPHKLYHKINSLSQKVACGSLRIVRASADSFGHVDFGDCNELLPALLSFPDSAKNCCCNRSVRAVLSFLEANTMPISTSEIPGTNPTTSGAATNVTPLTTTTANNTTTSAMGVVDKENNGKLKENCPALCPLSIILLVVLFLVFIVAGFVGYKYRHRSARPAVNLGQNNDQSQRTSLTSIATQPYSKLIQGQNKE